MFFPRVDFTFILICLLPEISLGRRKPHSVPQPSYECSTRWLWELPSLRGSLSFLSCACSQQCTWLNYTDRGAKPGCHQAVRPDRNKTTLCCIITSVASFVQFRVVLILINQGSKMKALLSLMVSLYMQLPRVAKAGNVQILHMKSFKD